MNSTIPGDLPLQESLSDTANTTITTMAMVITVIAAVKINGAIVGAGVAVANIGVTDGDRVGVALELGVVGVGDGDRVGVGLELGDGVGDGVGDGEGYRITAGVISVTLVKASTR